MMMVAVVADGDNKMCIITNTLLPSAICRRECAADRDSCMSDVGKRGSPLAQQCAQEYVRCMLKCSP